MLYILACIVKNIQIYDYYLLQNCSFLFMNVPFYPLYIFTYNKSVLKFVCQFNFSNCIFQFNFLLCHFWSMSLVNNTKVNLIFKNQIWKSMSFKRPRTFCIHCNYWSLWTYFYHLIPCFFLCFLFSPFLTFLNFC